MGATTYQKAKHHSGKEAPNEAFPGLLWRELNEWGPTKEKAKHIGHNVIADDARDGNNKPRRDPKGVTLWR